MNPVLIFLIILGAVVAWFLLAKSFRIIGGTANGFFEDVKKAVYDNDLNNDDEEDDANI